MYKQKGVWKENSILVKALRRILNLIKKQQKEIEELRENQCTHNISNECISKQKIRDKIEEYKEL